jgi:hypothetical protein
MAKVTVERTLSVPTRTLWEVVRDFGNVSWMPGGKDAARFEGDGVGMFRILGNPEGGEVHERLDAVDEGAQSIQYSIPKGIPFPVTDYAATMVVSDDGGSGHLAWTCEFQPDGVPESEAAAIIEQMYGVMIGWIEESLSK